MSKTPVATAEALYTLVRRAELDPREVEQDERTAVELTVQWNSSVLHVAHLDQGESFRLVATAPAASRSGSALLGGLVSGTSLFAAAAATGNYALGAVGTAVALAGAGAGIAMEQRQQRSGSRGSHYVVDAALLGGAESIELVHFDAEGATLKLPAGSTVRAEGPAAGELLGPSVKLARGMRYSLEVGSLTVRVRLVARARKVAAAGRTDRAALGAGLAALVAVGAMVGAGYGASAGPSYLGSASDDADRLNELRAFAQRAFDRQQEQQPADNTAAETPADQAAGRPAAGAEGRAGEHTAPVRSAHLTVRNNGLPPQLAQVSARDQVQNRGVFIGLGAPMAMVAGAQGPTTPFGGLMESGLDNESARGNLTGDVGGVAQGFGGLGNLGMGEGGGGIDPNTAGMGDGNLLGGRPTRGGGAGRLPNSQIAGRGRGAMPPTAGVPITDPGIDREVIRRVVLRNLTQVQHCQEQGFAQNPALAGRVAVRFVIGSEGNVLGSAVAESNLSVPSVASCIANAVRRWNFPALPNGGVASVTYPFNLMAPVQ